MEGRKLGFWETGAALLHDQAHGAGTIFSSTTIQGKIDPALLQEALLLMFQRHPLLRATLARETSGFFFVLNGDFASIPIRSIPREGEEHWLLVGEQELLHRFPTQKYLWRATLLFSDERNELILSFHHSIIDGFSCVHFINELLRLYAELDLQTFVKIEPLPLLAPVEQLLAFHSTKGVLTQEVASLNQSNLTSLDYQTFVPFEQRMTKSQIATLSPKTLLQIKQSCRERGVNVNSLLYATLLLSQRKELGATLRTIVSTPVNLRHFCKPQVTDEPLGVFLSYIRDFSDPVEEKTSVWQLATSYEKRLKTSIPKLAFLPPDFQIEDLAELSPIFDVAALQEKKAFLSACCVTNKGRFDFPDLYGALKLEAFFVTSSRQAGHTKINLSVTSVLDRMFLCFSYCHPLVEEKHVQAVASACLTLLETL
jgi:NRPS condensation-like uncharacterized protein